MAVRWCLATRSELPVSLVVDLIRPSTLSPEEDVRGYVEEALALTAELGVVHVTSAAPDRFRTMAVDASRGRLSLIEGGPTIERDGWQATLSGLRRVLETAGGWAVYGFVKRGSVRRAAIEGSSLAQDWVPVPHFLVGSSTADAFGDEYVPDAFGVQVLGHAHTRRRPGGSDWTGTPATANALVLEHRNPAEWFDRGLVPFGGYGSPPTQAETPIPDVVARARADFAEMLFTDDVAWGR